MNKTKKIVKSGAMQKEKSVHTKNVLFDKIDIIMQGYRQNCTFEQALDRIN